MEIFIEHLVQGNLQCTAEMIPLLMFLERQLVVEIYLLIFYLYIFDLYKAQVVIGFAKEFDHISLIVICTIFSYEVFNLALFVRNLKHSEVPQVRTCPIPTYILL